MNNYGGRQKFNNSPTGFGPRHHFQSTPKIHENNFHGRSPYLRSPNFNNQHNMQNAHNSSPYRQVFRESPKSFTTPTSSPENWNVRSNRSYYSDNSSSSYSGDVSQLSSYNSPRRNSGSSYYLSNRNNRYQRKHSFQSPESNDSNPGHSNDINAYVHPSMLEDPWKNLMAEMETKS